MSTVVFLFWVLLTKLYCYISECSFPVISIRHYLVAHFLDLCLLEFSHSPLLVMFHEWCMLEYIYSWGWVPSVFPLLTLCNGLILLQREFLMRRNKGIFKIWLNFFNNSLTPPFFVTILDFLKQCDICESMSYHSIFMHKLSILSSSARSDFGS